MDILDILQLLCLNLDIVKIVHTTSFDLNLIMTFGYFITGCLCLLLVHHILILTAFIVYKICQLALQLIFLIILRICWCLICFGKFTKRETFYLDFADGHGGLLYYVTLPGVKLFPRRSVSVYRNYSFTCEALWFHAKEHTKPIGIQSSIRITITPFIIVSYCSLLCIFVLLAIGKAYSSDVAGDGPTKGKGKRKSNEVSETATSSAANTTVATELTYVQKTLIKFGLESQQSVGARASRGGSTRTTPGTIAAIDVMLAQSLTNISIVSKQILGDLTEVRTNMVAKALQPEIDAITQRANQALLKLYGELKEVRDTLSSKQMQLLNAKAETAGGEFNRLKRSKSENDLEVVDQDEEMSETSATTRRVDRATKIAVAEAAASMQGLTIDIELLEHPTPPPPTIIPVGNLKSMKLEWPAIIEAGLLLPKQSKALANFVTSIFDEKKATHKVKRGTITQKINRERTVRATAAIAKEADDAKILEAGGVVEKEDDDTSPINVVGQGQPSLIDSKIIASVVFSLAEQQDAERSGEDASLLLALQDAVNTRRDELGLSPIELSVSTRRRAIKQCKLLLTAVRKADTGTSTAAREVAVACWRNRLSNVLMLLELRDGVREGVSAADAKLHPVSTSCIFNWDETTHVISFGLNIGSAQTHYVPNNQAFEKVKGIASAGVGGMPTRVKMGVAGYANGDKDILYFLKIKPDEWTDATDENGLAPVARFFTVDSDINSVSFDCVAYKAGTPEVDVQEQILRHFLLPRLLQRQLKQGAGTDIDSLNPLHQSAALTVDGAIPMGQALQRLHDDGTLRKQFIATGSHPASSSSVTQPDDLSPMFRGDKKAKKSRETDHALCKRIKTHTIFNSCIISRNSPFVLYFL